MYASLHDEYILKVFGIILGFIASVIISYMFFMFNNNLVDKEILFGEVYKELNNFSNSKLSVMKYDTGVQVSEGRDVDVTTTHPTMNNPKIVKLQTVPTKTSSPNIFQQPVRKR